MNGKCEKCIHSERAYHEFPCSDCVECWGGSGNDDMYIPNNARPSAKNQLIFAIESAQYGKHSKVYLSMDIAMQLLSDLETLPKVIDVDETLALAMRAGAAAIERNKALYQEIFVYDDKEMVYSDAVKKLRDTSNLILRKDLS